MAYNPIICLMCGKELTRPARGGGYVTTEAIHEGMCSDCYIKVKGRKYCACCDADISLKPYVTVRGEDDRKESGIILCNSCYNNPKCRICGKELSLKQAQASINIVGRCFCLGCSMECGSNKKPTEPVKKSRGHFIEWKQEEVS